jgi:hypothetical protein
METATFAENLVSLRIGDEAEIIEVMVELLGRAYCTFLNLVEHHGKESTVHRFEPARPRNGAHHIAANTE